jgi:hypothetical protein
LQEAGQSLSNNAGEVMLLHMVSIPSATQLSNHDQDTTYDTHFDFPLRRDKNSGESFFSC